MSIGENVGENVGENTGSSGSAYSGVTPSILNISAQAGTAVVTVNFNTGIKTTTNFSDGFSIAKNGLTFTISPESTFAGNGVLLFFVATSSFVNGDVISLVYTDSAGGINSVLGNIQLADQAVNFTISLSIETIGNIRNSGWDAQASGSLGGPQGYPLPASGSSEDAFDVVMNRSTSFHSTEQAHSGSQSCKMTLALGAAGDAGWGGTFNFSPVSVGSEFWCRIYMFYPSDWKFFTGPKQFRVHVQGPGSTNQGYLDIYLRETFLRVQCEPSDFFRNISSINPDSVRGRWVAIEQYVKVETGSAGVWRCWFDGALAFDSNLDTTWTTGIGTGSSGGFPIGTPNFVIKNSSGAIQEVRIHTQMNVPSSVTQSDYIDDVVITSATPNQTDAAGNPFIGV